MGASEMFDEEKNYVIRPLWSQLLFNLVCEGICLFYAVECAYYSCVVWCSIPRCLVHIFLTIPCGDQTYGEKLST